MLQEAIPGPDDQVYIFNGYFDSDGTPWPTWRHPANHGPGKASGVTQ